MTAAVAEDPDMRPGGAASWRSVALIGLTALIVRLALVLLVPDGEPCDLLGWEEAAQRVTQDGIGSAYATLTPGSLYPPAFFYPLWLTGQLYQTCCSPAFVVGTGTLDVLMRVAPSIADALVACLVFALARAMAPVGGTRALVAGLLYAVCPAVLVTVAQRGMIGDPYLAALVVGAVLAVKRGRRSVAAVCVTLAVLTKPQAAALLPLVALLIWRGASMRAVASALASSAVATVVILLPFVVAGTLPDVVPAAQAMANLHPYTQNSADNLWTLLPIWRLAGAEPGGFGEIPDSSTLVTGLSYRDVGLLAFGALQVLVLVRLGRDTSTRRLTQAAAVLALGFFIVNTRMHVNYVFLAFPFLCALAAGSLSGPASRLVLVAVTMACIVDWQDGLPWVLHRANALLYCTSFAVLLGSSLLRQKRATFVAQAPEHPPSEVRVAPGHRFA
ncbi:MAG: hypothetical protein ACR2IK_17885 [Chloroflexota bacterium]